VYKVVGPYVERGSTLNYIIVIVVLELIEQSFPNPNIIVQCFTVQDDLLAYTENDIQCSCSLKSYYNPLYNW
jgi:hypothetical protein